MKEKDLMDTTVFIMTVILIFMPIVLHENKVLSKQEALAMGLVGMFIGASRIFYNTSSKE
jgi:hypothetical protein